MARSCAERGEGGDGQHSGAGGCFEFAGSGTNGGGRSSGVDMEEGGFVGEVVITGPCVGDGRCMSGRVAM